MMAEPGEQSTNFLERLGIEVPVLSAGMAFAAGPALAAAVSNAGGMGFLGAGLAPPEGIAAMIAATRRLTNRPFGIGFVTPFFTEVHLAACREARPHAVVFFWEQPQRAWIEALQASGTQVWMQVGSLAEAKEAAACGVDAVIAQGAEAGGHNRASAGMMTLLPAVVDALAPLPVIAAGGIADGRGLAAALALGAQAAWCGTRFLAAEESEAHAEYKRRVLGASVDDTLRTALFGPEWPDQSMRVLKNRVVREWAGREAEARALPATGTTIGRTMLGGQEVPLPRFSVILPTTETEGDFEEMGLTMGESAGLIREVRAAGAIVREMAAQAEAILGRRIGR